MSHRRELDMALLGADVERKLADIVADATRAADPWSRDDNYRAVLAMLAEARRERDEARQMLGECYVLSGADTDGDGWEHTWRGAVREVRTLRDQYDEMVHAVCERCGYRG